MANKGKDRKGDGAQNDKTSGNNKVFQIATVALLGVLVVVGTVLIVLLTSRQEPEVIFVNPREVVQEQGARGMLPTEENVAGIIEQLSQPVPDGHFVTSMNTEWDFDSWDSPSRNARVRNSIDNTRTVYFDLTLRETSELIYSSPFIPIGGVLENFALDTWLPPGEHQGVVTYHLVDDNFENVSKVSVAVVLKIGR